MPQNAFARVLLTALVSSLLAAPAARADDNISFGLEYEVSEGLIAYTEARIANGDSRYTARSVLMEDITAIAVRDLEDRLFRTTVKAAARAAWKYALAEAMRVGVREVLPARPSKEALLQAVGRLRQTRELQSRHAGQILAFISCKGGSGATFTLDLGYAK